MPGNRLTRIVLSFVLIATSFITCREDAPSAAQIEKFPYSLAAASHFQNGEDPAFGDMSKDAYVHAFIGDALANGITGEELIDRLVYQQSMMGHLLNIRLDSVVCEPGALSCAYRTSRGDIRLRYRLVSGNIPESSGRFTMPMENGATLIVEVMAKDTAPQKPEWVTKDDEDLSKLAARAAASSRQSRKSIGARLAHRLRHASISEIERFLASYHIDLGDDSSCLLGMLVSMSILQNDEVRNSEDGAKLQSKTLAAITAIATDGNFAPWLKFRISHYKDTIPDLPRLFAVFSAYKSFFSKNPPYICEAMELSVRYAMARFSGSSPALTVIKALHEDPLNLLRLIEFYNDSVSTGKDPSAAEIISVSSAISRETMKALEPALLSEIIRYISLKYREAQLRTLPDIVFRADAGMVFSYNGVPYVFLSNFASRNTSELRSLEIDHNREWFFKNKVRTIDVPAEYPFEGSSEVEYVRGGGRTTLIMNHGFRTARRTHDWIEAKLRNIVPDFDGRIDVIHARSVNENYAHLDTALVAIPVIEGGIVRRETVMYYPAAFDEETVKILKARYPEAIELSERDAGYRAAESIVMGTTVIIDSRISPQLEGELHRRGFTVRKLDLSEFSIAGGGASSLVLELNKDLFAVSGVSDCQIQAANSVHTYRGIEYAPSAELASEVRLTDRRAAAKEHAQLLSALHKEGAILKPFDISQIVPPYDIQDMAETARVIIADQRTPVEFKSILQKLLGHESGLDMILDISGRGNSSPFDFDEFEEIAERRLKRESLASFGGAQPLYRFFKFFLMTYQEQSGSKRHYSLLALGHAVRILKASGAIPADFSSIAGDGGYTEKLWSRLSACRALEKLVAGAYMDDGEPKNKTDDDVSAMMEQDLAVSKLTARLAAREDGRTALNAVRGFLARQTGQDRLKYIDMLGYVSVAQDADIARASEAALACFKTFPIDRLSADFAEWKESANNSPVYLFFVFYRFFGSEAEGTLRLVRSDLLEKKKGGFGTSTEAHHRIINGLNTLSGLPDRARLAPAVANIMDIARQLKRGEQLWLGEDIVQLADTLECERIRGEMTDPAFLDGISKTEDYAAFRGMLRDHIKKVAFRSFGIDYAGFTAAERARYETMKSDLDDMFAALAVNKQYRDDPFLLRIVKLVYISIIKGDFNRIRYEKDYIPPYLDHFFSPDERSKIELFLKRQKSSSAYRSFSSMGWKKKAYYFWQKDDEFVKAGSAESLEQFIESVVTDCKRAREFLSEDYARQDARLPASKEERDKRSAYLNQIGRALDQILNNDKPLETLMEADAVLYEEAFRIADDAERRVFLQERYDATAVEQKIITISNSLRWFLDEKSGIEARLKSLRNRIGAAAASLSQNARIAALDQQARSALIPNIDDIRSVTAYDIARIRPYKNVINDEAAWKMAEEAGAAVRELNNNIKDMTRRAIAVKKNMDNAGEATGASYFETMIGDLENMGQGSTEEVLIGNTADPMIMMKALRGQCYDYRDGLNSDVLISIFFNPLVKVGYVCKRMDRDQILANQLFILGEVSSDGIDSPTVIADYFYGNRGYEEDLQNMMLFYKCTPPGIPIQYPIETSEQGVYSGAITVVQNRYFQDEGWDVFNDVNSRISIARMTDVERRDRTVMQEPFTREESQAYADANSTVRPFFEQYIRPQSQFDSIYLAILKDIIRIPSGTDMASGVTKVGDCMQTLLEAEGFKTGRVPGAADKIGDHVVFRRIVDKSKPTVMLSGHMDTVFNENNSPDMKIEGDRLVGPGVNDMKGGLVVMLAVVRKLKEEGLIDEINIVGVLNSDEETGSRASRPIIEKTVRENPVDMALVFEFAKQGVVIDSRQGIGHFENTITDPDAADRISDMITNLAELTDETKFETVNPAKIKVIDPRLPPEGFRPLARYLVTVTSGGGHAGKRVKSGANDCNYEVARKIGILKNALCEFGDNVMLYNRFIENPPKSDPKPNKLAEMTTWALDVYIAPTMGEAGLADVRKRVESILMVTTSSGTRTSVEEAPYRAEALWPDPVEWGGADAMVYIKGEYRFASKDRESPLKASISEFLGKRPKEPHRPYWERHPLSASVLSLAGYEGRGKFEDSASDANIISITKNSNGDSVMVFDGLGLSGGDSHTAKEYAYIGSLSKNTELTVELVRQLLKIRGMGKGMGLNSVKHVGRYGDSELSVMSMSRDYAMRNKEKLFALQSSVFDFFEMSPDDLVAEGWPAGRFGLSNPVDFIGKWDFSHVAIDENGEIAGAIIAYEERPAGSHSHGSFVVQYVMVAPEYKDTSIGEELVRQATLSFTAKNSIGKNGANADVYVYVRSHSETERLVSKMGYAVAGPAGPAGNGRTPYRKDLLSDGKGRDINRDSKNDPAHAGGEKFISLHSRLCQRFGSCAAEQIEDYPAAGELSAAALSGIIDEKNVIVVFSDNFLLDNVLPPYETYRRCREKGMPLWIVAKSEVEAAKIRALGFSEGVNFEIVTGDDVLALASGDRSDRRKASDYNLMASEIALRKIRARSGNAQPMALVTNPLHAPDSARPYLRDKFNKVSSRFNAVIAIPEIPIEAGAAIYADMLISRVVNALRDREGSAPLVIILPSVRLPDEYIRELFDRFNSEKQALLAA